MRIDKIFCHGSVFFDANFGFLKFFRFWFISSGFEFFFVQKLKFFYCFVPVLYFFVIFVYESLICLFYIIFVFET